jgi:hypothetical protein
MYLEIAIKLEIKIGNAEKTTSGWGSYTDGRRHSNHA